MSAKFLRSSREILLEISLNVQFFFTVFASSFYLYFSELGSNVRLDFAHHPEEPLYRAQDGS